METDESDRELLARLTDDPAALERFYRRHVDRVIAFAARRVRDPADVADVVAASFLAVLTSAAGYDPARGEPLPWLLGITARQIAGTARRSARERAAHARIAGRRLLDDDDLERLEERIDAERAAADVYDAIGQLKPRARETLLLVGVDGLSPREAAAALGISAPNFRMRLTAARRALTRALRERPPAAPPSPTRRTEVTR